MLDDVLDIKFGWKGSDHIWTPCQPKIWEFIGWYDQHNKFDYLQIKVVIVIQAFRHSFHANYDHYKKLNLKIFIAMLGPFGI